MDENLQDDRKMVYEIGYLLATSIADEHVPAEADKIKKIVVDAGSSIIAEEMPHRQQLAYTIRRKTVAGTYDKYDEAFFGWVKFETNSGKVERISKSIEILPLVIRMLTIKTVKENTYLGKRAIAILTKGPLGESKTSPEGTVAEVTAAVSPATIEEMDKSIDNMVKEA